MAFSTVFEIDENGLIKKPRLEGSLLCILFPGPQLSQMSAKKST